MIEISDKLFDALVEFYNAHLSLWDEYDETGYSKEDFYEAKLDKLIQLLEKELPDAEVEDK